MASHRTEKAARVIRESVSDTITTRLHDPRIRGLVTVTDVEVAPDLKNATVYLSVIGVDEKARKLTMTAIHHASGVIQAALGKAMTSRYVPHLRIEADTRTSKTLETLRMIEELSRQRRQKEDAVEEPLPDERTDQDETQ
jgi:ribosome-binding factor A